MIIHRQREKTCFGYFHLIHSILYQCGLDGIQDGLKHLAKQLACYLKPIQLPPTRIDVIKETVHRSHFVAEGYGQDYALVTYHFTTAKIAKRIQSKETSIFLFSLGHLIL